MIFFTIDIIKQMLKYGHRILLYYFAIFSPELKECYTIRSAENHWWYDIWL